MIFSLNHISLLSFPLLLLSHALTVSSTPPNDIKPGLRLAGLLQHRKTTLMKMLRQREIGQQKDRFSLDHIKQTYGKSATMEQLSKWDIRDKRIYDSLFEEDYKVGKSLQYHAAHGNIDMLRYFVEEKGICKPRIPNDSEDDDMDDDDDNGSDRLMCFNVLSSAAKNNQPAVIKYWVTSQNYQPEALGIYVTEAARSGSIAAIKTFMEFGVSFSNDAYNWIDIPFNAAIKAQQLDSVRFFVRMAHQVLNRFTNEDTLFVAALGNSSEIFDLVQSLQFSHGDRLSANLFRAIKKNITSDVVELLRQGANPNPPVSVLLPLTMYLALDTLNDDIVRALFDHRAYFAVAEEPELYPVEFNRKFYTTPQGLHFLTYMFSKMESELVPLYFTRLAFSPGYVKNFNWSGHLAPIVPYEFVKSVSLSIKQRLSGRQKAFIDLILAVLENNTDRVAQLAPKLSKELGAMLTWTIEDVRVGDLMHQFKFRKALKIITKTIENDE